MEAPDVSPLLPQLVDDWGGFEDLVAKLHETGTVSVEHNVTLTGKSGAPRQCDVVVRHREGLYEHLIIVECKYWQKNVDRLHIDALATAVADLNASKGVIMTAKGFQSGAELMARNAGIELFLVRELTDQEWGPPGRVFDLVLQLISRSVGDPNFHQVRILSGSSDLPRLSFRVGGNITRTPTIRPDGTAGPLLEEVIRKASLDALQAFTKETFILNGGMVCTRYMEGAVNIEPPDGVCFVAGTHTLHVAKISFVLGIKYVQWRYTYDRAKDYMFALALEDCIRGE